MFEILMSWLSFWVLSRLLLDSDDSTCLRFEVLFSSLVANSASENSDRWEESFLNEDGKSIVLTS